MVDIKDISDNQKNKIISALVNFINDNNIQNSIDYYQIVSDEEKIEKLEELIKLTHGGVWL